jgi:hypothetical protein
MRNRRKLMPVTVVMMAAGIAAALMSGLGVPARG